jgi:hypothetical protein
MAVAFWEIFHPGSSLLGSDWLPTELKKAIRSQLDVVGRPNLEGKRGRAYENRKRICQGGR